ncbi:methyl-accepting chemotaxis protein 4 [mine drainage metagenome]|uniref:Methyl-accepting chemotaxis protein 4 n=1 Tax=mine drainage metagenome TaxID=410659 RepID=A0A1J5TQD4_9ZZZZ
MQFLFSPATYLMSRLRFPSKFALTGAIFSVVLGYFAWHSLAALNARVQQIKAEQAGSAFIGDLVSWNKALIDYRRVAITAMPGDESLKDRLKQQAMVTEEFMRKLEADALQYAPLFDSTKGVAGMRDGWNELQSKVTALPVDKDFAQKSFSAHGKEFDRLYAFMHDLGDSAGLSFEPDIDLFYLGFPLANNTPKVAGVTVRIYAYQTLNIARGTLTPQDKVFYEVTEARLKDVMGGVEAMLASSMKSDPVIKERLDKALENVKSTSGPLLAYMRQNFIGADTIAVNQQQITEASKMAIESAWTLVDENRKIFEDRLAERGNKVRMQFWGMAALVLAGVLASIYLFIGMYLSIANAVTRLNDGTSRLAAGDFTARVRLDTRDELSLVAQHFNEMAASLSSLITGVKSSARQVLIASGELSGSAEQISKGSREQVSAAQSTAAAVEEVSVSVSHVSENVSEAVAISEAAAESANQGQERILEAVEGIRSVSGAVEKVVLDVTSLGDRANEIGLIVSTIKDIADQTNLLALNAAIEAARAGEQGRGFAVVADEVRKLAENTRHATENIASMIGKVQDGVQVSIKQTVESRERMLDAVRITESAAGVLDQIKSGTRATLERIREISSASNEQAAASQDIARHIENIAQMAEKNETSIGGVTASAQQLKSLSETLNKSVASFKLDT